MAVSTGRLSPVILALVLAISLALFGCIEQLQQFTGGTTPAADTFGSQLEALNGDIYAAKDYAAIANLTSRVLAMETEAAANPGYQKYAPLIQAQRGALQLANATLLYGDTTGAIAKSGIDCPKDYSAITAHLRSVNSTRQSALPKANSYLAGNPASSVRLLITLINSTDTEGMYLFATLLGEEYAYRCPGTETPAKTYATPLTESEAVKLVVDELVGSGGYYVYSIGKPLDAGTVVSVSGPGGGATERTMSAKTWFFMLDKTPEASWSHDVRFVYVDAATADYQVTDEVFNPVIGGVDYWLSFESRLNTTWIAYPKNPAFKTNASFSPPFRTFVDGKLYVYQMGAVTNAPAGTDCSTLDCCKGVGKNKALVVIGDDQDLFHKDGQTMYDFLTHTRGLSADDVTYLTANKDGPESDGITSLKTLAAAIDKLASESECCDRIFIYITGHGNNYTMYEFKNKATGKILLYTREGALSLSAREWSPTGRFYNNHLIDVNPYKVEAMPDGTNVSRGSRDGGEMWAANIGVMLDKIKSCYATVMYDSCHSGPAGPMLAGRGRTIMTTSGAGSSWGYSEEGGAGAGGAWNSLWILAHGTFSDEADANNDGVVSDREAYDFANREINSALTGTGLTQKGTWTDPRPPCKCCDVVCNDKTKYLCVVAEGNGTVDPKCKKIGDYCGPLTVQPNEANVTEQPLTAGACGDGVKVAPEECDKNDSQCPKYRYCDTKTCTCKQYPLICGDGHIAAGESCDPKASPTGCPENEVCDAYCRCAQPAATCGDGQLGGLEQCESGIPCTDTSLWCNLVTCQCGQATGGTTTGGGTTGGETTPQIPGGGGTTTPQPYCGDGTVNSNEQCESDSQCSSGYHCSGCSCIQNPAVCGDGTVNGNEQCDPQASPVGCGSGGVCSSGCRCVYPPTLNCGQICGYTSGASPFQGTFTTSQQCLDYVSGSYAPRACYLTCTYAYLYTVSNIAGSASCCCGMMKAFPCSDCPGQNPQCPGQSTCTANAPSWYSPP